MKRRALPLLLACVALAGWPGPARAHRLEAQCFVRPGWRIQVESWYETGDPPRGARVQVFRAGGALLAEGKADKNGVLVFTFREVEPLRIVVTTVGHRAEVTIPAGMLNQSVACTCAACLEPGPSPFLRTAFLAAMPQKSGAAAEQGSHAPPLADHATPFPMARVLAGVGILLAIAAAFKRRAMRKTKIQGERRGFSPPTDQIGGDEPRRPPGLP